MKLTIFIYFAATLAVATFIGMPPVHAGKIDDIRQSVKRECQKEIDLDVALQLVKKIYLSCVPGQEVEIDDQCKVPCQKPNIGTVVGG